MGDWVEPGRKAPDFTLPDADGNKVKLSSLRGSPVVQRYTFLIDADGVVRRLWKNVKVDGHDEQVIKALKEL